MRRIPLFGQRRYSALTEEGRIAKCGNIKPEHLHNNFEILDARSK